MTKGHTIESSIMLILSALVVLRYPALVLHPAPHHPALVLRPLAARTAPIVLVESSRTPGSWFIRWRKPASEMVIDGLAMSTTAVASMAKASSSERHVR